MKPERGLRMHLRLVWATAVYGLLALLVQGQLYLITGSPAPKYDDTFGAALHRVGDDGAINSTVSLVATETGTEWIGISYDLRKAVILPSTGTPLIVIDLDSAAVVKRCELPSMSGVALIEEWLSNLPGRGPAFAWYVAGDKPDQHRVWGLLLDSAASCKAS